MILSYHNLREANQLGTDTEAGTLAGHNTHAGAEDVQYCEHGRRRDGDGHDLVHGQRLLGDEDQGQGHGNTLNHILDNAGQKLIDVHLF